MLQSLSNTSLIVFPKEIHNNNDNDVVRKDDDFNFKKKNHQLSMATNPKVYKDQPFHSFQVYKIPHPVQKICRLPELRTVFRSNLDNTFLYPVVRSHKNSDIKKILTLRAAKRQDRS